VGTAPVRLGAVGDEAGWPAAERRLVAIAALGAMLVALNSTMIAAALPAIMAEFAVGIATAGWLVTAYLVAMASLQPIAGRLGDRLGRGRMILGGLVYFGLASIAATSAASFPLLVGFRVQQAIAAAMVLPNATALLREVVPADRRAGHYGLVGGAVALAAAAGPLVGGLVAGAAGWRAIFSVSLPLVLIALVLGWRSIPARAVERPRPPGRPGRLLRVPGFAAASGAVALSNLAMYSTLLAVPLLLARQSGWTSAAIGGAVAALPIATMATAPLGGRLADRLGRRRTTVLGLSMLTIASAPLALGVEALDPAGLVASLALGGAGLGLSTAPLQAAAIEAVDARDAGVAAGVFSTGSYLGSIAGSILFAAWLARAGADSTGFAGVFATVLVAALLSSLVSLGLSDQQPASSAGPDGSGGPAAAPLPDQRLRRAR
jgi:MFS family permease